MVSYVNDLRLSELATGEGSGTWGTTTNTNLELIGEAFSFGTEAITTNADTHTTTIADGSTDPGRSMFLKYTGTLDSTCTITIGPNTVSKLWFIENATSGSQDIIIKQGSGATVTIANGQTKAIYSDGAGSGGAMVDAFTDLSVPSLFVDGATTITTADNLTQLSLISTDADANVGPRLDLLRNSASPAADDALGALRFMGNDSAANNTTFGLMQGYVVDPTDGSEDGKLVIETKLAGFNKERISMDATETVFNEDAANLDFRIESDNITSKFFLDAGDDRIIFGSSTSVTVGGSGAEFQINGTTGNSSAQSITRFQNDANSPILKFGKSRNGTIGSNTIVQSGDNLGLIQFCGDDGTNLGSKGADILAEVDGTPSSDDMPGRLVFRTTADGADSTTERMRINSSGNVGIGTSSPDYNFHVTGSGDTIAAVTAGASSVAGLNLGNSTNKADGGIRYDNSADALIFRASNAEKVRIDSSGNLLVGTDSGDSFNTHSKLRMQNNDHAYLQIKANSAKQAGVLLGDTDDDFVGGMIYDNSDDSLRVSSGNSECLRIDSSGNVLQGITTIPTGVQSSRQLISSNATGAEIIAYREDNAVVADDFIGAFLIGHDDNSGTEDHFIGMWGEAANANGNMNLKFAAGRDRYEAGTSDMMISSLGNLLVGRTTSGTLTVAGSEFQAGGAGFHIRDGGTALFVGRKTSDGSLVEFSKDGTTVGSIGSEGGDALYIQSGTTSGSGFRFHPTNGAIDPLRNGASADNAIDLGRSAARFDDIFATNGTIQTSDRNEKQDIEELSDAEQRVAVAAKGLLRKFRWINSVEAKGDEARIHFGIIAQDLQDAFTAEGLDAGRYAMFISSTWTDEDGNEQTRLGVRYSELLAFIISAI